MSADGKPVDDRKICFCHDVMLSRILEEIARGAVTLEEIRARTRASTGCGGCEFDLVEILEEELGRRKAQGA